jgi:hypothetical protein
MKDFSSERRRIGWTQLDGAAVETIEMQGND